VTEGDRDHLLELARDKTLAGRRTLVEAVTDLFFDRKNVLSDRERALMTDILRQLVHEVEVEVRVMLAQRLSRERKAPSELVRILADDQIEVAHPILLHSRVLQDGELVEIVHHRTLEHQLAIAMRRELSEAVSDALVSRGDTDVIRTLLENDSAQISKTTLEYLVEQSQRVDSFQNPLLRRPELDSELARRMYYWVSAAVRKYIVENFEIDVAALDDELENTVTALAKEKPENTARPTQQLADRLADLGEITAARLVETLRQGEVALFEAMFAKATGLRLTLVRRFLFERGGEGLAIACKAIGVDEGSYASLYALSRKARHEPVADAAELARAASFYGRLDRRAAATMLRRWQREHDYLRAVWELDNRPRGRAAS
jgi:uncharacterized protein (DUF2336 family)